jgi:hypothetical protein
MRRHSLANGGPRRSTATTLEIEGASLTTQGSLVVRDCFSAEIILSNRKGYHKLSTRVVEVRFTGPNNDDFKYTVNFQPVILVSIDKDWYFWYGQGPISERTTEAEN